MSLRTTRQHLTRAWRSNAVSKLLVVLFLLLTFLTIYSLDQGARIDNVRTVVEKQEVLIRAQCAAGQEDHRGCRDLLDRLIRDATPEQLAALQTRAAPRCGEDRG